MQTLTAKFLLPKIYTVIDTTYSALEFFDSNYRVTAVE